jgi:putative heme iron utilization protein
MRFILVGKCFSMQSARTHMASDQTAGGRPRDGGNDAAAGLVRDLVRMAWKATLGTVGRSGGFPYTSLVAIATQPDGAPLLLLSGLAEHTKNLDADQRASILIDGTSAGRAALTGARLTLVGRIREADPATARRRYLARHPDASGFIDFADFKLYSLDIEWAHLVAGFGRIVRLLAGDVTVATGDAGGLIDAESSILDHMNDDHPDAISAIAAAHLAGGKASRDPTHYRPADWRMIGCDPEGFDLTDGQHAIRIPFSQRITTPDDARAELVEKTRAARSRTVG